MALAAIAAGAIYLVLTRGKKWDETPRPAIATEPVDGTEPDTASSEAEPKNAS
jgi:hypothetical protein